MRLAEKVALITGVAGLQGIGFATAKIFAREGAKLALADISDEVTERAEAIRASGFEAISFIIDLIEYKEVNHMANEIIRRLGRIDILVNIAGIAPRTDPMNFKSFIDITEEEWDRHIDINLKTTFNCIKAVLPGMMEQKYGKIVNVSSVTGPLVSFKGSSAYSAAKAGVLGLTRALAIELAEYGITVNAVGPGWIDTGRELEREAGKRTPMKRAGKPEEVGNLILFLASDESKYLTGHMIVIDGGNIIQEYKGSSDLF